MFNVHPHIQKKLLEKHKVTLEMVKESFANREGGFLTDSREGNKTTPPTRWFVAETDRGIKLKVCFVFVNGTFHIKTAYPANFKEQNIYARHAF